MDWVRKVLVAGTLAGVVVGSVALVETEQPGGGSGGTTTASTVEKAAELMVGGIRARGVD